MANAMIPVPRTNTTQGVPVAPVAVDVDAAVRSSQVKDPLSSLNLRGLRVLKFGGSSVATPDRIRDAGRIVLNTATDNPVVVVVSAFQGVTNALLDCATRAERRDAEYVRVYDEIAARHHAAIDSLLGGEQGADRFRSSPDSSAARRMADQRRSAGTDPTTRPRLSAPRWMLRRSRSGLTSTAS